MVERTLQDESRRAQAACTRFEADLSSFVDGEKTSLDGVEIARHLESCDACRSFVNALAGMSRLHLFGGSDQDVDLPSGTELWGDLTRRMLEDNCKKLSAVLYELGKALVVAGQRTAGDMRVVQFFNRKPGAIRQLSHKGQALFREHRDLAEQAADRDVTTITSRRGLFPASEPHEATRAFESGRACLEQCLRLDADHHEARIYLAKYFRMTGRLERARHFLRMVLHSRGSEATKFFARQQLSHLYATTRQFERAVEVEREMLAQGEREHNELYQAAALTNLSIYYVKLGRLGDAEAAIHRLAQDFPKHLETVTVPAFRRAREFKQALLKQKSFLTQLRGRYPSLFAS